jgi:hypothetical protein
MAAHGTGPLRQREVPQALFRGARTPTLGRRRLPPASNDNRPTLLRVIKMAIGPVLIAGLVAAIWYV